MEPKPCPANYERNPKTNRCRKSCDRIPKTNRCRKPCKDGKERNPKTNRCKKVSRHLPVAHPGIFYRNQAATSCYIDSILFALLYNPSRWVRHHILSPKAADAPTHHKSKTLNRLALAIREDLKTAASALNTPSTSSSSKPPHCGLLRTHLKEFDDKYYAKLQKKGIRMPDRVEWLTTQNEPLDFVKALTRVFHIPDDVSVALTLPSGEKRKERHVFYDVSISIDKLLQTPSSKTLSSFPVPIDTDTFIEETTQKPVTKTTTIRDARILMVNVPRNFMGERKLMTKIAPPPTVTLKSGRTLTLSSILLHKGSGPTGGHYTTVFKSQGDNSWREYDDLDNTSYKLIGATLDDALEWNKKYVQRNGVSYIYTP